MLYIDLRVNQITTRLLRLQHLHHLPPPNGSVHQNSHHQPDSRHDAGRRYHCRLDHARGQHGRRLRLRHHHQAGADSFLSPDPLALSRPGDGRR